MSDPIITFLPPEIIVVLIDFPARGREIVTPNEDGTYTVLINARLSAYAQREALDHALEHIRRGDFDKVDVQTIEAEAHT